MKHLKLFFALFAMLALGVTNAWGEEVTETIMMKGFGGKTNNAYQNVTVSGTSDAGTAMVAYAYNGNNGQVRGNKTTVAGASVTSEDKNKNWSLYNSEAMGGAIKSITITQTATGSNKFQNEMYVSLGTTSQGSVTTITNAQKHTSLTTSTIQFDIDPTKGYTYFKLLSTKSFTGGSVANVVVTVTYETSGGSEPETPATDLTDAQFAWSAATAEATMGASNAFPTLTNTLPVSVTYESSNTAAATIAADGTITLVAPGTTTISAKFAGGEVSGTTYDPKTVTYALTVLKAPATPTSTVYVKVTSTAGITNGEYLIVYEDAANNPKSPVAFNGALTTLDAVSNTIEVEINSNTIAGNTEIDAATFTIDATAKTVKSKSGYYIGQTSDANGLKANNSTKYENALSIGNDGTATIKSGGAYLRYNSDANNWRFRYYKSSSYSGQKAIALYKKASKYTVTIADCTNGSVNAKMGETSLVTNDQVLSGTQITLGNEAATGYKLTAYDVYKTGDNTTKVTVTDGKFIMPEFDVTISATFEAAKTLTGIEITNAATQATFWQGEAFNSTGLKVIANFNGAEDEDVTSKITVTGSTATAGNQTVTVSFTEGEVTKEVTYTITVKAIPNTKETAYTVADAFDIIDKLGDTDKMYITGFVSQADLVQSTIDQYKNADYWISADGSTNGQQLEAYRGKYLDNTDFTSVNQIMVGDEVIIYGKLTKYGSTYEFAAGNYLVSLKRDKQQPELSYTTTEYNVNLGDAFTAPTLNNPHILAVTYSTNNEDVATVDETNGAVTIKAAGTVTITASFAGNDTYVTGSASYTINITDPNVSSVTFDATMDIPTEGLTLTKNGVSMTFTGGAMDNGENYRCYSGQKMTISYADGNITKIVLECTTNNDAKYGPGCFETETASYSYFGKVGTWTGEAKSITFNAKDQVRMTAITVYYKQDNRTNAELAWSEETVSLTVGDAFTAPTFSNPNNVTGIEFTSSNTELATVNNAGVISLVSGKTGTATITATFEGDDDYKAAEVKCTISVNPKTNKVVILAEYEGEWYALKAAYLSGKTDRLDAIHVNYVGGKLYNVAEADKASIEWSSVVEGDKVSFINDGKYLKGKTTTTLLFEEDADGLYQWDNTTYTMTIGTTERSFLYNGEAFRNFAVSNAGKVVNDVLYSSLPVVTAPVYKTGTLYTITATAENGIVIGAGIYEADAKVTLTADPAMDYTFVSWTKGGEVVSTTNPFVFEATENLDLVANFQEITATTKTLTGKFSVGEYEYAEFATGNLQHNPKSGDWRFAKQQYQYVGEANINVGDDSYEGWIDMLGWSTNDASNNYGVNPNNVNDLYGGTFQDWGDLFSADENWSTLSADQWKYLLNKRTNASSLKQIARVGSVVGIMLFPDNWNAPLTVTAQHDSYFDVDIHNYTLDQWAALENAGALFLPAAGRRAGGYGNTINKDQEEETNPENLNGGHYKHYDNGNIYCYYWTSTINESTKDVSYLHNIQALGGDKYTIGTGAVWGEKGRYGQSVRLAKVTDIIRKELTVGQLGTVCLPYNIPSGQVYGATFYTLEGKMENKVVFDEVTGELAAGVPYLFQASAEEISCFPGTTIVTEPNNSGAMKGTFVDLELTELSNIYYFAKNALWSCVDLTKLSVPANRAYVNMAEVTAITGAAPVGVRRITLGVNGQNTATGVDQVEGDNVPTKMIINGQLFILRGEKMYDAQGKLVK